MGKQIQLNKNQQLLYAIIKANNGVDNKISLAKLEYFADFIHYAFHSKSISDENIVYTKQEHGPLSKTLTKDLKVLENENLIYEDSAYNYKVKNNIKVSLSKEEMKTILYVVSKYGKTSADDLKRISHGQAPFLSANEKGVVELFTAYNLIDEYPDYESFSSNNS